VLYAVKSVSARKREAIGSFYPIEAVVEADDPKQAVERFREHFESNAPPTWKRLDLVQPTTATAIDLSQLHN
jgi:hypothetical protein